MDQFLEVISKAYVYIPASVLAVLAILIPAIVKIAKICTSNTANAVKISLLKKDVKDLSVAVEYICDGFIDELKGEKNYLMNQNEVTLNKKQVALNNTRIDEIEIKIQKAVELKGEMNAKKEAAAELEKNKKKKVRVKVIKQTAKELTNNVEKSESK